MSNTDEIVCVRRPALWGHKDDPEFETESRDHAVAYARVFPRIPWLRERLRESGRFTSEKNLEGELQRNVELLVEVELKSLLGTKFDVDHTAVARNAIEAQPE